MFSPEFEGRGVRAQSARDLFFGVLINYSLLLMGAALITEKGAHMEISLKGCQLVMPPKKKRKLDPKQQYLKVAHDGLLQMSSKGPMQQDDCSQCSDEDCLVDDPELPFGMT